MHNYHFNYVEDGDKMRWKLTDDIPQFDDNNKIIGGAKWLSGGTTPITKNEIVVTLKDIFDNPQSFVGCYPIHKIKGITYRWAGYGSKDSSKVLWAKFI